MPSNSPSYLWHLEGKKRLLPSGGGVILATFPDPYSERLFLEMIRGELIGENGDGGHQLRAMLGSEVSQDMIESNLCSLSLFGAQDSFLIMESDGIGGSLVDFMLETKFELSGRYLLFTGCKQCSWYDHFEKNHMATRYNIKAPPPWEMGSLLSFLARRQRIRLSQSVLDYIIHSVPNQCGDFLNVLKAMELHFPENKQITEKEVDHVRQLVSSSRLDIFALASQYGRKDRKNFFSSLEHGEYGFDELRQLFSFMQSHLIKLGDVSYLGEKKRVSKYDREIQGQASRWSSGDITGALSLFGELEILAKSKSDKLKERIRSQVIYYSN